MMEGSKKVVGIEEDRDILQFFEYPTKKAIFRNFEDNDLIHNFINVNYRYGKYEEIPKVVWMDARGLRS